MLSCLYACRRENFGCQVVRRGRLSHSLGWVANARLSLASRDRVSTPLKLL